MQSLRAALVLTFLVDDGEIDVTRAALKATARTRLPRGFVESAAEGGGRRERPRSSGRAEAS